MSSITEVSLEDLIESTTTRRKTDVIPKFKTSEIGDYGLRLELRPTVRGQLLQTRHKSVRAEYDDGEFQVFVGASETPVEPGSIQPSLREFFATLNNRGFTHARVANRDIVLVAAVWPSMNFIHKAANCVYLHRGRRDDVANPVAAKIGYCHI